MFLGVAFRDCDVVGPGERCSSPRRPDGLRGNPLINFMTVSCAAIWASAVTINRKNRNEVLTRRN